MRKSKNHAIRRGDCRAVSQIWEMRIERKLRKSSSIMNTTG